MKSVDFDVNGFSVKGYRKRIKRSKLAFFSPYVSGMTMGQIEVSFRGYSNSLKLILL
jgi:hypothetical protein